VDDVRIPAAGDGSHAAGNPGAWLLEAAEAALQLLDRIDAHAPEGLAFGGEGRVRRQLREAIRRARAEAEDRDWSDAETADEAEALDEERAAFLGGFRAARAELRR